MTGILASESDTVDAEPKDSEFHRLFGREDLKIRRAIGAVALIDALGFRGIWKGFPSEKVLQFLARARERATKDAMLRLVFDRQRLSVIAFSDTLLIVAFPRDDSPEGEGLADAIDALAATVSFSRSLGLGAKRKNPSLLIGAVSPWARFLSEGGCSSARPLTRQPSGTRRPTRDWCG